MNLKLCYHVIEVDGGTFKVYKEHMVHLGMYEFKDLNTGKITSEESFMNTYAEEVHKSEQVAYLNKDIGNQCQNLTEIQCNELLKLLQKFEYFLDGTFGTWKIYPVYF